MSLGFKLYSFFNGNLVQQDSLGNKYYRDKNNPSKRWVVYAPGFGPESLPTQFHNWLHNTSDDISPNDSEGNNQERYTLLSETQKIQEKQSRYEQITRRI